MTQALVVEDCPFCEGTGKRLVPPKNHGQEHTYQRGCRCDLCTDAHAEYRRAQRAKAQSEETL